jgi:hypothetical protein
LPDLKHLLMFGFHATKAMKGTGMMAVTKTLFFLVVCLGMSLSATAQNYDRSEMPTAEEALAAIENLRRDPVGVDAHEYVTSIMVFGHLSDDVFVSLKARYTPWMRGNLPDVVEDKLIAAFVGGNMEYQITSGVNGDRPYEGTLTQLIVYTKLRDAGIAPKIRKFEQYLQWQKDGRLKARVK